MGAGRWRLHRLTLDEARLSEVSELAGLGAQLGAVGSRLGALPGQRFVLDPSGFPDLRINAVLASARMRNMADTTNRDYSQSLLLWLNFLDIRGVQWWTATSDDAEEFEFWRTTDPANPEPVGTSTFAKDVAACKKFYRWVAARYTDVSDIFAEVAFPRAKREARVKWLDPAAITRWRDVGLRGRDLSGRRDKSWNGRNEQRDSAFVDGLYGTGLRLTEWASVVLPELPQLQSERSFYTCRLADACAKGGYGHPYWIPREVVGGVAAYIEGARARAVRDAQAAGRYERIEGRGVMRTQTRSGRIEYVDAKGDRVRTSWNALAPQKRQKLFRETVRGLEPVALWLNADGLPRDPHGWHHTFHAANDRIAALGLTNFKCTAHMHRHSFALKWFAIGKLVYAAKIGHLEAEEARDFRVQFGDTWHLVQTMLGHARVETTKNVYLEPFRNLEVELLLAHAEGFPLQEFMSQAFRAHPQVANDPAIEAQ